MHLQIIRRNMRFCIIGKRSFASSEGLVYLPGDVDGDGEVSGMTDFTALDSGGEALGYEVSLYLPQDESVTPVRYMMEPRIYQS